MHKKRHWPKNNTTGRPGGEEKRKEGAPAVTGMDLFSQPFENPKNTTEEPAHSDFRKENEVPTVVYPPKEIIREEVKYIEKPHPKITEIRIFFDNGTYEVFKPEK